MRWNGPAFKAGIAPQRHAHRGRTAVEFTPDRLQGRDHREARKARRSSLLVKNGDTYRTFRIDYREGPKYPHLERIAGAPDRLGAILAPRKLDCVAHGRNA